LQAEQAYETIPLNGVKIIVGNPKAKVDKEEASHGTIGLHSLHDTSNGNDFATNKNVVINSASFPVRKYISVRGSP
jgi:hypothetical protein